MPLTIWVDADACPGAVREILLRAAARTGLQLTFVANQRVSVPRAANVTSLQVPRGFDAADAEILRRIDAGDLVITQDIPLASEAIERGANALSPRGEWWTTDNVRAALNMRDFMDTMRASGVDTGGGPGAFGPRDRQAFANALDRFLARK